MGICYTTICDVNYLAPALTLYRSIKACGENDFRFYTLDDTAARYLDSLKLSGAQVFAPDDYISETVNALRSNRSAGSFAFTVKPVAILHALEDCPEYSWAGHLDVDMYAFGDPGKILSTLSHDKHVSLTPHRFSPSFKYYQPTAGRFNAGYAAFRNTDEGVKILRHWCRLCIEWCHDYVEEDRYGDQKYLEILADTYPAVDVCRHKGANAAPWNIDSWEVSVKDGRIHIGTDPLLFYHFQGFKIHGPSCCSLYASPELIVKGGLRDLVYKPYVEAVYEQVHYLLQATGCQPVYSRRSLRTKAKGVFKRFMGEPDNLYHYARGRKGRDSGKI